jgi:hypothetical protein
VVVELQTQSEALLLESLKSALYLEAMLAMLVRRLP